MKEGEPNHSKASEIFEELYGVPLKLAIQLSEMPNEIGKHWKNVFNHLKNGEGTTTGKDQDHS